MKKVLLTAVAAVALLFSAAAADSFAFSAWNNCPKGVQDKTVNGFVLGLPISVCQEVNGASISLFGAHNKKYTGFAFSLLGYISADSLEGVQLSHFNFQKGQHGKFAAQVGWFNSAAQNGVQLGLINHAANNATFQLGIININKGGYFPVMILFNFGK